MTNAPSWTGRDAAAILGDARPRSLRQLFDKGGIWLELYRDWLAARYAPLVPGLDYLTSGRAQGEVARGALTAAYPHFYREAGELKELVRRRPREVATRFPWTPPNPASLLGDARPKDLDELLAAGRGGSWFPVARAWYAYRQPIGQAAEWLDFLVDDRDRAQSWSTALEATIPPFADDIGELKDHYRSGNGGTDAGQTPGTSAHQPVPAPGGRAPDGRDARRQTADGLLDHLNLVAKFVRPAAGYADYTIQVAADFQRLGGAVGAVGDAMASYAAVIAANAADLGAAREEANAARLDPSGDLQEATRRLRDAVYTLAWNVDLSYQNYYGGWPHDQLQVALSPLAEGESPYLRYAAYRALTGPVSRLPDLLRRASDVLDGCLALVHAKVAGYHGGDAAQAWGQHEVVAEVERADAVRAWIGSWSAETGERPDTLDESCAAVFDPSVLETS